jgi:hypothetical protein
MAKAAKVNATPDPFLDELSQEATGEETEVEAEAPAPKKLKSVPKPAKVVAKALTKKGGARPGSEPKPKVKAEAKATPKAKAPVEKKPGASERRPRGDRGYNRLANSTEAFTATDVEAGGAVHKFLVEFIRKAGKGKPVAIQKIVEHGVANFTPPKGAQCTPGFIAACVRGAQRRGMVESVEA